MSDFGGINWDEPLDLETAISRIPPAATVKGVLFRSAVGQARAITGKTPGRPSYDIFGNYPTAELARVLADCAQLLYPNAPPRKALRDLGHEVFSHIKSTTAGTFLFSVAGNSFLGAIKLVGQAYKVFSNSVSATYEQESEKVTIVKLRNIWSFPDCYHVGIFRGAMDSYGVKADFQIRRVSHCDLDLKITLLT